MTCSREEYQYVFKRAIDITICIIILYGIMDIYMVYVVALSNVKFSVSVCVCVCVHVDVKLTCTFVKEINKVHISLFLLFSFI